MTEDEIGRMIDEAVRHQEVDEERRQLIELRNTAEGLIVTTERSLNEYSHLITPLDVEDIRTDMETLQDTLDTVDPDEMSLLSRT